MSTECAGVPMSPWSHGADHIAGNKCIEADRDGDDVVYLDTSMCSDSGGAGDVTGRSAGTTDEAKKEGSTNTGTNESTGNGTIDGCDTYGSNGSSNGTTDPETDSGNTALHLCQCHLNI